MTVIDTKGREPAVFLTEHHGEIIHLEFLPDGRLLSAGQDASVAVWELDKGASVAKFRRGDVMYWYGITPTPDAKKALVFPTLQERLVKATGLYPPYVIDLATGKLESLAQAVELRPLFPEPAKQDWLPDKRDLGNAYLRLRDGRWLHMRHRYYMKNDLRVLAEDKKTVLHEFRTLEGLQHQVYVSTDGKTLYQFDIDKSGKYPSTYWMRGQRYGGGRSLCVRLWDLVTFKEIRTIGGEIPVSSFWVSPDDKSLVILHADAVVRVWDIPTGMVKHRLELPPMASRLGQKTYFSPDGRFFISEGNGLRTTWSFTDNPDEVPSLK